MKGLLDQQLVERLQDKVHASLLEYNNNFHPNEPNRFGNILLRLPELRSIGTKSLERLFMLNLTGQINASASLVELLHSSKRWSLNLGVSCLARLYWCWCGLHFDQELWFNSGLSATITCKLNLEAKILVMHLTSRSTLKKTVSVHEWWKQILILFSFSLRLIVMMTFHTLKWNYFLFPPCHFQEWSIINFFFKNQIYFKWKCDGKKEMFLLVDLVQLNSNYSVVKL